MPKPGYVVTGLILFLDGIALVAFCLAADLAGLGQGYGLGPRQVWGVCAGILLAATGLGMLLRQALRRPGTEETDGPLGDEGEH